MQTNTSTTPVACVSTMQTNTSTTPVACDPAAAPAGVVVAAPTAAPVADIVCTGKDRFDCVPTAQWVATLPGFERATLFTEAIRQVERSQKDAEDNDVGGYMVVADAAAALLYDDIPNACRWANNPNQVNIAIAPSLTYIDSGHSKVSERIVYHLTRCPIRDNGQFRRI